MSGTYAEGNRVCWGNGIDRIVKRDFDNHEVIDDNILRATDTVIIDSDVTDRNHHDFPLRKLAPGAYRAYGELTDGVLLARSRASISLRISFCLCSVMG